VREKKAPTPAACPLVPTASRRARLLAGGGGRKGVADAETSGQRREQIPQPVREWKKGKRGGGENSRNRAYKSPVGRKSVLYRTREKKKGVRVPSWGRVGARRGIERVETSEKN